MKNPKVYWIVGASHESFGLEGTREYKGTELGASRLACKIARRGGYGWRPYVSAADVLARAEST